MSGLNRDEINRIIYDNGLFHGTMALGVVMDADHLERFANLVATAEREECLEACRMYFNLNDSPEGFQNGVECCIAVITHKSDPDVMARIKARGHKL